MNETNKLGCFYLHFFYPSNIYLNPGANFLFRFEGKAYCLVIHKQFKSLVLNDFDNRIVRQDDGISNFQPVNRNIEVSMKALATVPEYDKSTAFFLVDFAKHYHREYYQKDYTEMIICFDRFNDPSNVSTGLKAIEHFINSYRLVTDDILTLQLGKMPYIAKVFKEYFHEYSPEELGLPEDVRIQKDRAIPLALKQALFPFWNLQGKHFQTDSNANGQNLKAYFANDTVPSSLSEFLLKAKEEFHIHQNFKYSFIESWTAIEIAITSFLRRAKTAKGISQNKLDDFEGEVGISYLINIELPLVHENPTDPVFKELLGKIDGLRKIRNKMIHENRVITSSDAERAVAITMECLNFLGFKKY